VSSPKLIGVCLITLTLCAVAPAARAAPRELVIANENLAEAGDLLDGHLNKFLRRIEEVTGWPKNSLKGKALVRPVEALDYIRKNRSGFAILPIHQVVEGAKELKFQLLGRAVGMEGTELYQAGMARVPKSFTLVGEKPSIKVAGSEVRDVDWLTIITGESISRDKPAALVEVPSSQDALKALEEKKVDVAIVSNPMWRELEKRTTGNKPDLEFVFGSPKLPPSAVVAVGKFASAADRKKFAAAIDKICKESGADPCGRVGLMYIQPGMTQHHQKILDHYQSLKATK
jgi:hypothetical protein